MPKKFRGSPRAASSKAKKHKKKAALQTRAVPPPKPRPYAAPTHKPPTTQPQAAPTPKAKPQVALDYSYVGPELRRIGIFAAIIFAIMGMLAILLR